MMQSVAEEFVFGCPTVTSESGQRIPHWFAECPCGQVTDIAPVRPGDTFDAVTCDKCGLSLSVYGKVYR